MMDRLAAERGQGGFALVVVLFVLIACALLASGMLFISTEEMVIARGGEELLRARLAAESAVREELLGWDAAARRQLPQGAISETRYPGEMGTLPEPESVHGARLATTTTVERLTGPYFLVQARAVTTQGTVASVAAVVRQIEPSDLWRSFPGALSTAGTVDTWGTAALRGFGDDSDLAADEEDCPDSAIRELEAVFGTSLRPPVEELQAGTSDDLRLGPLDRRTLQNLADRVETGTVAPAPVEADGKCDLNAPANWGAPRMPRSPCFDAFPTIFAPDGLRVTGGVGQGMLIVDGDLTLAGETEFFGVVLLTGNLHLDEGAKIHGAVTMSGDRGSARLEGDSRITYSPCAIRAALEHASYTNRVFHPRDRGWISMF